MQEGKTCAKGELMRAGDGLPHQEVGPSGLAEGVVLAVHHQEGERDGLQIIVNVLQTP